jgi:twitching motility two-component system response regulator PilH
MARILIVDDSRFAIRLLVNIIEKAGYDASVATNGREGLSKVREEKPDLIITDLLMPVMDGLKMMKALKEENIDTPVIVLTANIQDTTRQQCLEMGASGFVNKPPKKEELHDVFEKYCGPGSTDRNDGNR